jgi:hypothetical protein
MTSTGWNLDPELPIEVKDGQREEAAGPSNALRTNDDAEETE